jgi:hypothetical protein
MKIWCRKTGLWLVGFFSLRGMRMDSNPLLECRADFFGDGLKLQILLSEHLATEIKI